MKLFTLLAALLLPYSAALAQPLIAAAPPPEMRLNKLFVIGSDRDNQTQTVHAMIDSNNLVAGLYADATMRVRDNTAGNVYWLRDIESDEGALLLEAEGHKLAYLQGLLDRESQEGRFKIRYLSNGLTKKYKTCDFLLKKGGRNSWVVKNAYTGETVKSVKVITSAFGIKTLEGICPK